MAAGQVSALLILDGVNPVYTAPADLPFLAALDKVALRVHHGLYQDETSDHCHWHIIPRWDDDPVDWPWPHTEYLGDELAQMQFRIQRELNAHLGDD